MTLYDNYESLTSRYEKKNHTNQFKNRIRYNFKSLILKLLTLIEHELRLHHRLVELALASLKL